MKWSRVSHWAELSADKRYSVSAAKCGGLFKFQSWRWNAPDANGYEQIQTLLGTFDDAESARQCCEADAMEREVA